MTFGKLYLFLSLACLLPTLALGQTSPKAMDQSKKFHDVPAAKRSEVLKSWQRKMATSGDLTLSWEQSQYKALRKRWQRSFGKGFFQAPQRFRWDMNSLKQSWIFDGKRLIHVDHNKKEGLSYPISGSKGKEFLRFIALITHFEDLRREYRIQNLAESKELLKLSLKPYQDHELSKVQVTYLKNKALIQSIRMDFVSGNHTTLTFSGQKRSPLSPPTFSLPAHISLLASP